MNIDGKKIANEIMAELKEKVSALPFIPKLIDVAVGDDPVTESYVKIKAKRASEIGIQYQTKKFDGNISQEKIESEVALLNQTKNLCGLIIQLPLPKHLDQQKILDTIDPRFDVDVITSLGLGKFFTGKYMFAPATASAIMKILDYHKVELEGKKVLLVGAGYLVGRPVALLLLQRKATLIIANASTRNLAELGKQADIVISGAGVPNLISSEIVREGAVVIDAGTAESNGGIGGDVDFESVSKKAALVSPVPGGVGPVTVAMLLQNTVQAASRLTQGVK